jgi:ferrous iron transport protein B
MADTSPAAGRQIALVGQPNVGKSVVFHRLTGRYVTVSNYPGTTVEITRGRMKDQGAADLIDTPGILTIPSHAEDEQVTERVLLYDLPHTILQVGDAKNLQRTLLLTLQLAEMGIPMVLALNMMDEADLQGVRLDHRLLEEYLGIPVVPTVAVRGEGMEALKEALGRAQKPRTLVDYPPAIERAIQALEAELPGGPPPARALALLLLAKDPVAEEWAASRGARGALRSAERLRREVEKELGQPAMTAIQAARVDAADRLSKAVARTQASGWRGLRAAISHLTIHPFWGLPILALVLYGLYLFVGLFGAGTLVDLLESRLFGEIINPWVTTLVEALSPHPLLTAFLVGEYGLWTVGVTYAFALILPIVTTFFLAFGVLEDSGYLPRLAVLTNRLFRIMGLNGKAVLPMILGLGCVTMATLTARTLESRRDRLLVILLLALAVPCSAQLGVVMGMLASISMTATLIWLGVVLLVFIAVGWLAGRLLPGERSLLLVELPPLRPPLPGPVITKTLARLEWYLKEVVPLFLLGSAILFALDQTGLLAVLTRLTEPVVAGWLGLPPEASAAFLIGFLRRDFGATGLFIMESRGLLTPQQVVVAMVTITLFIPCIAAVLMIAKARGWKTTLAMMTTIFPLAFLVGGLLQRLLALAGWGT